MAILDSDVDRKGGAGSWVLGGVVGLVGMIGQAYARRNHERTDELEVLTSDIRRMTVDVVPQIALDHAPDELRRYYFEALSER